jgi:hypothetical protein
MRNLSNSTYLTPVGQNPGVAAAMSGPTTTAAAVVEEGDRTMGVELERAEFDRLNVGDRWDGQG